MGVEFIIRDVNISLVESDDDILYGGEGNDRLYGGSGDDTMEGVIL